MIQLSDLDFNEIRGILAREAPKVKVWAFGSRVKGSARKYSDLDLLIEADHKLSLLELASLKDTFEESNIPIRVDILDSRGMDPHFYDLIKEDLVLIQSPNSPIQQ